MLSKLAAPAKLKNRLNIRAVNVCWPKAQVSSRHAHQNRCTQVLQDGQVELGDGFDLTR